MFHNLETAPAVCDICCANNKWADEINLEMIKLYPQWAEQRTYPGNDPIWNDFKRLWNQKRVPCLIVNADDGSIASEICKIHLIELVNRLGE